MACRTKLTCVVLVLGALVTAQAMADVTVRFNPVNSTVALGGNVAVQIVADIPQGEPVLGWGFDLAIDNGALAHLVGSPAIGPLWTPVFTPDGDELGGLAFPSSIWGSGVLLATVTFQGDALGTTDLFLSDDYPIDETEGFALDPSGFATVIYNLGTLTVIPEPATLALLVLGGLTLLRRR